MKKVTTAAPVKTSDPLDINARLYRQLGLLLDDMESMDRDNTMTFPQRVTALIAVGRVQKMFADLRKADLNVGAGAQVKRYAAAFASPHGISRGKANTGTIVVLGGDNDDDRDDDDDGDDAA